MILPVLVPLAVRAVEPDPGRRPTIAIAAHLRRAHRGEEMRVHMA